MTKHKSCRKNFGRTVALLASIVLAFGFASCNHDSDSDNTPQSAPTTYSVAIKSGENGTVVSDKASAAEGDTVTLTVTPNDGYEFAVLSVEDEKGATVLEAGASENGTFTFTMPKSNATVRAFFKKISTYIVIYADGLDDCHIVMPTDTKEYQAGDTVTVMFDEIVEREGYDFAGWKDGNGNIYTDSGDNENPVTFTMAVSDVTLTAQWVEKTYSVTVAFFLNMTQAGGATGTVTPSKTAGIKAGETVTLSVTPNDGCKLLSLSLEDADGTTVASSGTNGTFTFVMPASDVTVYVVFKKISYYRVTYADGTDSEHITVPSDTTDYQEDDAVTVMFDGIGERAGYDFAGWSDGSTTYTSGETTTFTMPSADVTLTAQWEKKADVATKVAPNAVGDIVLSDGTAVSREDAGNMSVTQRANAVAVIFYAGSSTDPLGAKTLGVGLQNTRGETTKALQWAPSGTTGYTTKFTDIQCSQSSRTPGYGTAYYRYYFLGLPYYVTGDFDGSDNWEKVCAVDSTASENAATNYPAFNWANNYGEAHSLAGNMATGWYLPTCVELRIMYGNMDTVNAALEAAGGTKIAAASFWSSNQGNIFKDEALDVSLADSSSIARDTKSYALYVCAIREF